MLRISLPVPAQRRPCTAAAWNSLSSLVDAFFPAYLQRSDAYLTCSLRMLPGTARDGAPAGCHTTRAAICGGFGVERYSRPRRAAKLTNFTVSYRWLASSGSRGCNRHAPRQWAVGRLHGMRRDYSTKPSSLASVGNRDTNTTSFQMQCKQTVIDILCRRFVLRTAAQLGTTTDEVLVGARKASARTGCDQVRAV